MRSHPIRSRARARRSARRLGAKTASLNPLARWQRCGPAIRWQAWISYAVRSVERRVYLSPMQKQEPGSGFMKAIRPSSAFPTATPTTEMVWTLFYAIRVCRPEYWTAQIRALPIRRKRFADLRFRAAHFTIANEWKLPSLALGEAPVVLRDIAN